MPRLNNRRQYDKYSFSVEGETEKWYLLWLRDKINADPRATRLVAVKVEVEKDPLSWIKSKNRLSVHEAFHVFDFESEDKDSRHEERFKWTLERLKSANEAAKVGSYRCAYSNYTFEAWIIMHKARCKSQAHRSQYVQQINACFDENFENLKQYKKEKNFKRLLSKLSLEDVIEAVERAEKLAEENRGLGRRFGQYCGFEYCLDNPATDLWVPVKLMLKNCGIMK